MLWMSFTLKNITRQQTNLQRSATRLRRNKFSRGKRTDCQPYVNPVLALVYFLCR